MLRDGQEVGNHTYDHPHMPRASPWRRFSPSRFGAALIIQLFFYGSQMFPHYPPSPKFYLTLQLMCRKYVIKLGELSIKCGPPGTLISIKRGIREVLWGKVCLQGNFAYIDAWHEGEKTEAIFSLIIELDQPARGGALDFGCGNGVVTGVSERHFLIIKYTARI
jgi:hypothetical protein